MVPLLAGSLGSGLQAGPNGGLLAVTFSGDERYDLGQAMTCFSLAPKKYGLVRESQVTTSDN